MESSDYQREEGLWDARTSADCHAKQLPGAAAHALSGVALMAAVCLIIAVGITVYYAATANRRREQGKTLGGWIIIPVALYAVSIPYLLFFWWFMSH